MLPTQSRLRTVLDAVATVMIIAASGLIISVLSQERVERTEPPPALQPVPSEPVSIETATIIGNPNAAVVIIEFSEFQCPFCEQHFRETEPRLRAKYITPGVVKLAFRHLPLERVHKVARRAALAAECAGRQGKFQLMHDALFSNRKALTSDDSVDNHAGPVGLDVGAFKDCVLEPSVSNRIDSDIRDAKRLGVNGTPTFMIGKVQLNGFVKVSTVLRGSKPFDTFKSTLDELLK